jgi:hypothetical protein
MGIPHYVLIYSKGKIVRNNTDRPSVLLRRAAESELEKLLRQ